MFIKEEFTSEIETCSVAFCSYTERENYTYIEGIAVKEGSQSSGIGSYILKEVQNGKKSIMVARTQNPALLASFFRVFRRTTPIPFQPTETESKISERIALELQISNYDKLKCVGRSVYKGRLRNFDSSRSPTQLEKRVQKFIDPENGDCMIITGSMLRRNALHIGNKSQSYYCPFDCRFYKSEEDLDSKCLSCDQGYTEEEGVSIETSCYNFTRRHAFLPNPEQHNETKREGGPLWQN